MTSDPAAESERHAWLDTCSDFERHLLLGQFAGGRSFDEARAWIERVRAEAAVTS